MEGDFVGAAATINDFQASTQPSMQVDGATDQPPWVSQPSETLEMARQAFAGMTAMQLKEWIERSNPGISRKDLEASLRKAMDQQIADEREALGVRLKKNVSYLLPNPGQVVMDKKLQGDLNKIAFGSAGLYERAQRKPYWTKGWNVARVNLYQ